MSNLEADIRSVLQSWSRPCELADFAQRRSGYGNSDGGFGLLYPHELDDFDRVADGLTIPVGQVRIYGFFGLPDGFEINVPETLYLQVLADFLETNGWIAEARHVRGISP